MSKYRNPSCEYFAIIQIKAEHFGLRQRLLYSIVGAFMDFCLLGHNIFHIFIGQFLEV